MDDTRFGPEMGDNDRATSESGPLADPTRDGCRGLNADARQTRVDEATGAIDAGTANVPDNTAKEPEEAILRLRAAFARMPLAIQVAIQQAVIHQRDVDGIAAVTSMDAASVRTALTSGLRLMHQALQAENER